MSFAKSIRTIDYLVARAKYWANGEQEVFILRVHAMYGWFIKNNP